MYVPARLYAVVIPKPSHPFGFCPPPTPQFVPTILPRSLGFVKSQRQYYDSHRPVSKMSQNEPLPKSCGLLSLPTELLLEIFREVLAPELSDIIQIQRTPRQRLRLHGPRDAYIISERDRCNLRQVSKLFKKLTDAHPRSSSST